MCRTVSGAALLALAFVVLPGAAAPNGKDGEKKDSGWVRVAVVTGTLTVEESKKALRVTPLGGGKIPNPVAMAEYQAAVKAYKKARGKDERASAYQSVVTAVQNLKSDLELVPTDEVVIRIPQPK